MGKKIWAVLLAFVLSLGGALPAGAETQKPPEEETAPSADLPVTCEAPSAILLELSTGTVLYEKNSQEKRSPASITKIMTLLLIFEALENGSLKLEEEAVTSAHAKSMGGSQVFLEEGEKQTVETLIKCIVIASGNDASVTMAEHLAGSEEAFVAQMNQEAERLGMVHTHFEDCCGLTDSENHYTTAGDVAIMSRELVTRFPQILAFSSVWMENITHITRQGTKEFTLSNTNKLVRSYEGCRGLKTGSTSAAKYCVSAVAERKGMQLLAVVMGAPEPKSRFRDAANLLNYGFGCCQLYTDENKEKIPPAVIEQGVSDTIRCRYQGPFCYLDTEGKDLRRIQKKRTYRKHLRAPVKKGDVVGQVTYTLENQKIGTVDLIAAETVPEARYTDVLCRLWNRFLPAL